VEILVQKARMTREGCRVTTILREGPDNRVSEEIILQAEDLVKSPVKLEFLEEGEYDE